MDKDSSPSPLKCKGIKPYKLLKPNFLSETNQYFQPKMRETLVLATRVVEHHNETLVTVDLRSKPTL